MATVSQSLRLNDGVTPVMNKMNQAMERTLATFERMQRLTNQNMDMSEMQVARTNINEVSRAMRMAQEEQARLNSIMRQMETPDVNAPDVIPNTMPRAPTITPVVDMPEISQPILDNPTITPVVDMPEISQPILDNPTITPVVDMPEISQPILDNPTITPEVDMPHVGELDIPTYTITLGVDIPEITLPEVQVPNLHIPQITMPPISVDLRGYDEAVNNINSINTNMATIVQTQDRVNRTAQIIEFIPASTQNRIQRVDSGIQSLVGSLRAAQTRQQQLNSTMSRGESRQAISSINRLERGIQRAVVLQGNLNTAMQSGDLSAINRAATQLTRTINRTGRETQRLDTLQQGHNRSIDSANRKAGGLLSTLKNIAGAYLGFSAAKSMFSGALDQAHTEVTFQARFGDEAVGTAMFNKLQKQAQSSAFAFEELAQNTLSFMSMSTDPKQLDGLNNLAEKLAMFDTTGQGLAGAGFSIKEAMSGDIVSLAERFNISKSAIRGFGLDELGKAGDIEGFIKQFDAMLEAMNMGDEAVAMLANSPKQRLSTLASNFKTAFSSAATESIDALQPLIDRLNEFMTGEGFQTFLANLSMGLTYLANGAVLAWDGLTQLWGVLTSVYAAIEPYSGIIFGVVAAFAAFQAIATLGSIAMGIYGFMTSISAAAQALQTGATFAATAAQYGFNTALLACPITWIVLAIVALVATLIYLWKTNDQVAAWFMRAWNNVLNFGDEMSIGFMKIFYGILNFMGSFKAGFLSLLETAINGAISMINDFIALLNKIPGVSIDVIGEVSFGAEAKAEEEANRQARAADISSMEANYADKVAEREQNVLDMLADREQKRQEQADKKAERADKPTAAADSFVGEQMSLGNIDGIGDVGNVGSVGGIEDPVEVEDDDFIKLMQELAQAESIQNFITLKPEVQVSTGDIRNDVDISQVVKRIEESIQVEVAAHAKEVYNLG